MQFELSLTGADGLSTRRMTTLHLMLAFTLCGLGAGSLALYWFTSVSPNFKGAYRPFVIFGSCSFLLGLGIATIAIFYRNWLMKGRRSLLLRGLELAMLLTGSALYSMDGQNKPAAIFGIVAVMIGLAAIWELRKPRNPSAVINSDGIAISNGPLQKVIAWDEIESVLLRHGILTIELSGNKLIQRVLNDQDMKIDEIEHFTKTQISLHEKKRLSKAAW